MILAPSEWTSLEITRLVAGVLTPLVLLSLGIWLNRLAKRVEAAQWANQKLIEKRISIYDELAPLINDLYCYYMCVGNYKEFSPIQIIEIKRKLDKKLYVYVALFSPEFKVIYNEFIHRCFQSYTGVGHDAKLRTQVEHQMGGDRRTFSPVPWKDEWDALFSSEKDCSQPEQIRASYERLMSAFSGELGVGLQSGKAEQKKAAREPGSRIEAGDTERGKA